MSLGPAVGRRLNREEYFNSIEVVLGVDLNADDYNLPRDNRVPQGFRNSADDLLLSPGRVAAYDAIGDAAVAQADVGAVVAAHASCTDMNAECYDGFVDSVGAYLLRRPLPAEERPFFTRLFAIAQDEDEGFQAGAALVVRAMLQSPRFLYRLESQEGATPGEGRAVDAYELATRISFLVWNAAPDRELIDAAASGTLIDGAGNVSAGAVAAQVDRLLAHPRAHRALRQYIEQWLYLDAIPETFPIGDDMKEETYRLFEWLTWDQDADLMRVFTEERAELSGDLAEFYGIPSMGGGFNAYDLSSVPERIGVLTNASVLAARTVNPSSSMIDRGLFVLNDIFCDGVAPPDDPALQQAIDENMVPEDSGLSQRERFAIQSENELCRGCHGFFDPLGLAFEQYGAAGQFITEDEYGNALTGGGSVALGDVMFDYASVADFAQELSRADKVSRCLVQKSIQHAYGRPLRVRDADLVTEVQAGFAAGRRTYRSLIKAIAAHPEFAIVEVAP